MPLPNLPSTVRHSGKVVELPAGDIKGEAANSTLLIQLRDSELRNARGVNACKAHYGKLQLLQKKS